MIAMAVRLQLVEKKDEQGGFRLEALSADLIDDTLRSGQPIFPIGVADRELVRFAHEAGAELRLVGVRLGHLSGDETRIPDQDRDWFFSQLAGPPNAESTPEPDRDVYIDRLDFQLADHRRVGINRLGQILLLSPVGESDDDSWVGNMVEGLQASLERG